ncbi:amino acid ABC transporter ATP-binding protein [Calidifontibacter sp. DB0510]|uniref:Amino acid ABC transporter ATP-binding protein n=1 Tax=Metallococcus carri TaxID=1656884 RepID=A0A967B4J4_9MICO|nr:amino acid ABC transporter ATP-binding protein [Metallococcus carri]NHN57230.1 amino acid ABC transporter ATP-binding protein [Metallococcus carri]NOP37967.1 amino acid ABC transporter ATP-binding protein [Calidifontibacter sp. DB2511S]
MSELVRVERLKKSFGEHTVLQDVSFAVPEGSVTVILGPSGSGKTTLLRSLNGLELPDAGTVRVSDATVDFADVHPGRRGRLPRPQRQTVDRLTAQSGMVFQAHNLFPHRTAIENVIEGPVVVQRIPREEARSQGVELLAKVGLAEHADKFPYQLSGGQQQRVGIARALALKPKLVLFDEPTSALDPELVGEVLRVIRDLATEGWTMVIVTHEVKFAAQVADQVLFIDGGVVVEHGTPGEVISHPQNARTQDFLRRILEPI